MNNKQVTTSAQWGAIRKIFSIAGILIAGLIISASSCTVVDSGQVGVVTHFGAVQNEILPEGMHFIMPFRTNVVQLNVRIQKVEAEATASSRDMQNVSSIVALNFYLDKANANKIYQELGLNYEDNIIHPTIQESIKSISAKYTAEELITKRQDVKQDVFKEIKERLSENNIIVSDFSIVDFNFSPEFNKAIEAKQIAEQFALTAKNDLVRVKTEAEQAEAKAEGEARSQLAVAKAQAEANELLSKSITDQILKLKAIERWDGVMPVSTSGGTLPLLNIK